MVGGTFINSEASLLVPSTADAVPLPKFPLREDLRRIGVALSLFSFIVLNKKDKLIHNFHFPKFAKKVAVFSQKTATFLFLCFILLISFAGNLSLLTSCYCSGTSINLPVFHCITRLTML